MEAGRAGPIATAVKMRMLLYSFCKISFLSNEKVEQMLTAPVGSTPCTSGRTIATGAF